MGNRRRKNLYLHPSKNEKISIFFSLHSFLKTSMNENDRLFKYYLKIFILFTLKSLCFDVVVVYIYKRRAKSRSEVCIPLSLTWKSYYFDLLLNLLLVQWNGYTTTVNIKNKFEFVVIFLYLNPFLLDVAPIHVLFLYIIKILVKFKQDI